jgi:hypothetical protein
MTASALAARAAGGKGGGGEHEQARLRVGVTRLTVHHRGGMGLEDGSVVGPVRIQAVPMRQWRVVVGAFGVVHCFNTLLRLGHHDHDCHDEHDHHRRRTGHHLPHQ